METISMRRKERKRLEAFSRVKSGGITLVEASERLSTVFIGRTASRRTWN
jgi:hypothetical protein